MNNRKTVILHTPNRDVEVVITDNRRKYNLTSLQKEVWWTRLGLAVKRYQAAIEKHIEKHNEKNGSSDISTRRHREKN